MNLTEGGGGGGGLYEHLKIFFLLNQVSFEIQYLKHCIFSDRVFHFFKQIPSI